MISHLFEDPGYRSGVDPSRNLLTCPGPSQPLPYRHATLFPKFLGKERDETKTSARETCGSYHLHRKTGNSNWKIKCFAPFRLEVSGNKSSDLKRVCLADLNIL